MKLSFLDRVRNRVKDSLKGMDKKRTMLTSNTELSSNGNSASSLKELSDTVKDEIKELPFYDDVTSFGKILAEDEYLSPLPPRLVQDPTLITLSSEMESGEIYDDIGSSRDPSKTSQSN